VRGWGIRAGALLHTLARWLLPVGSRWLLLRHLHLESSDVGLESSVAASETEGAALALASVASSSGVT
jgi:hypothetical protein